MRRDVSRSLDRSAILTIVRHRLFVHIVWTTHDRQPILDAALANALKRRFPAIADRERATVLAVGIVATHVHLLVRLHPACAIPRLVQRLKGVTAHDLNAGATGTRLRWAVGYSVSTVSEVALGRVAAYVLNQSIHHPAEAIQDES